MGLSGCALLLMMLVAMTSLLQPSSSSSSSNSTAASWCTGRIDDCLINAEAGDEGTDNVVDHPMVDFSEMSRRVLAGPTHYLVIPTGDQYNPVCGKSQGEGYKRCIAEQINGGKTQNCKGTPYNRDC